MPKIIPFKAVKPTRAIVGLVAARPYQSYTVNERESRMDYNPYSFLHIVNPGYKYEIRTRPSLSRYGDGRKSGGKGWRGVL